MKRLQNKMEVLDKSTLKSIKGGTPEVEYYYEDGEWKWRIIEKK